MFIKQNERFALLSYEPGRGGSGSHRRGLDL